MAADYVMAPPDQTGRWLTSTVTLNCSGGSNSASNAARLASAILAGLPNARVERESWLLGVDLRLNDPADQNERNNCFLALDQIVLSLEMEPRLINLIDWVLRPTRRALPDVYTIGKDRLALEAREDTLRLAAAPLLAPFLASPRIHGISGSIKGFRAFHTELTLLERHLVRQLARTPKSWPAFIPLRGYVNSGLYSDAELLSTAESLRDRDWLEFLGPQHFVGLSSTLAKIYQATVGTPEQEISRGKLLSGLSERELLGA